MKNLSLLIIRFAFLEDWIYALVVMILLSIKWVIALLWYGLERTITTRGELLDYPRIIQWQLSAENDQTWFLYSIHLSLLSLRGIIYLWVWIDMLSSAVNCILLGPRSFLKWFHCCEIWFCNNLVRESEPNSWEDTMKDELDRGKYPRMPWHDVHCALWGPPCRDVARHFVQRWNYAKVDILPRWHDFAL